MSQTGVRSYHAIQIEDGLLPRGGRFKNAAFLGLSAALISGALWLRISGLDWPPHHPDEPTFVRWINYMLGNGFHPESAYPPLYLETGALFHLATGALREWLPLPPTWSMIIELRLLNALLSTLTVLLVLSFAPVFGRRAAFLGASLLAALPIAIDHAHYAESDTFLVFVTVAAVRSAVAYLDRPGRLRAALLGLLCGATIAAKYNAAPVVILGLLPLLAPRQPLAGRLRMGGIWAVALTVTLALLMPYAWLDGEWFRESFRLFVLGQYETDWTWGQGETWSAWWESGIWKGTVFLKELRRGVPLILVALAVAGWLYGLRRDGAKTAAALAFPAAYLGSTILLAPYVRSSECLTLGPWIALGAALGLEFLWCRARGGWGRGAVLAAALITVAATILPGLRVAVAFSLPDTITLAGYWAEQNLPRGAAYLRERYCPKLSRRDVETHRVTFLTELEKRLGMQEERTIVCTSSLASERFRDPVSGAYRGEQGSFYRSLEEDFSPQASFHFAERAGYFLNPRVTLLALLPADASVHGPPRLAPDRSAVWPDAASPGKTPALTIPPGESGELLVFSSHPLTGLRVTATSDRERTGLLVSGRGARGRTTISTGPQGRSSVIELRPSLLFKEPYYPLRFTSLGPGRLGIRVTREEVTRGASRPVESAGESRAGSPGGPASPAPSAASEDCLDWDSLRGGIRSELLPAGEFSYRPEEGSFSRELLLPEGDYCLDASLSGESCGRSLGIRVAGAGGGVADLTLEPDPSRPCRASGRLRWDHGELADLFVSGRNGSLAEVEFIRMARDPSRRSSRAVSGRRPQGGGG